MAKSISFVTKRKGDFMYHCEKCNREIYYDGVCWECREKIEEETFVCNQQELLEHLQDIGNYKKPAYQQCQMGLQLGLLDMKQMADTAIKQKIYDVPELFYHASEEVENALVTALQQTKEVDKWADLLCCLAMCGGEKSLQVLQELEQNPTIWQEQLYAPPSVYAQYGGWTFDKAGNRQTLFFAHCVSMEKGGDKKAGQIAKAREDICPHCGGKYVDMLVLDGKAESLRFLGVDGVITTTCCPSCVAYQMPAYSRFTLQGDSEPIPNAEGDNYAFTPEEYENFTNNTYGIVAKSKSVFYGAFAEYCNTVGGFANWVDDFWYPKCPDCGKTMIYLAQIQWDTLEDGMAEGTLYIHICKHCHVAAMHHQQT